ncbi:triosephosphate isomerase [Mesonia phycicola]|uniref:Triosephosphate isomerase n=1 Tax=Mesonia phycicola TaxID=579105 RepID=A0A1M6G654_9FLAO|nr:triose-phosphate isomerase [Mesonia phycicola]SHJ05277.1 triosephosphate isomerase [Mesonia phycicola]
MREKIVAGNWKMNCDLAEMEELLAGLKNKAETIPSDVSLMVAPSFTNLYPAFQSTKETPITVVAQNMHQSENGAFTGEVSPSMLKSVGVETVILGHSERRAIFNETDELLAEKVNTALAHGMKVIFCFGEELKDRKEDKHFDVVKSQLQNGLFHIEDSAWSNIVLAYEPVWAIGTGETASPEQAQEMHAEIRKMLASAFSQDIADKVSILYGGSVKPANAKEIFAKEDVDGGLIGGASLKADDFLAIANSY